MNLRSEDHFDTINIASAYPGAGKGTLAKCLINHLGANGHEVDYVEVGAIVRTGIKEDVAFRDAVQHYEKLGQKVPDEFIVSRICERVKIVQRDDVLILDGFPRKKTQVDPYIQILQQARRNDVFVYLNVPRDVAEARMIKRAELAIEQGKTPRPQDLNSELRNTRLDLDQEEMGPVVEHASKQGKLIEIDARGTLEEVRKAVFNALRERTPILFEQNGRKTA